MRPWTTLALFLLALPAGAAAPPGRLPRDAPVAKVSYRGYSALLGNGLQVVAFELLGRRTVQVSLSFDAGSAEDPQGKEGLAEVAVAALLHAAPGPGPAKRIERLHAAGMLFEPWATRDDAGIRITARAHGLRALVPVVADICRQPGAGLLDDDVLERRDSLAAFLEAEADSAAAGPAALVRRTLPGTRYDRAPATGATVRKVTAEDVRGWLAAHARCEGAVLSIVGPDDATETVGQVTDLVGAGAAIQPARGIARAPPAPAPALDASLAVERVTGGARELWIGWAVPGLAARLGSSGDAAAMVLDEVLSREAAQHLEDEVVRVDCSYLPFRGAGVLAARAELTPGADAAAVRRRLERAAVKLPSSWTQAWNFALLGLSSRLQWRLYYALEEGAPNAAELVRATGEPDAISETFQQIRDQVGPGLRDYLRAHLREGRAAAVLLEPAAEEPARPGAALAGGWASATNLLGAAAPGAREAAALAAPPGLDRFTRRVLANGLEVLVLPRNAFPKVNAVLVVRGGCGVGEQAAAGAVLSSALAGLRADRCNAAGYTIDGVSTRFEANLPSSHVAELLDRLACWTRTELDKGQLKKAVAARADELRRRPRASAAKRAYDEGMRAGVPAISTPAQLEAAVTRDYARARLAALRPDRATLVITGNLLPTEALFGEVEHLFGRWRVPEGTPFDPAEGSAPQARRTVVVDYRGSTLGRAEIAVRVPPAAARDAAAHEVARSWLEGHLSERLLPVGGTVEVGTAERAEAADLVVIVRARAEVFADLVRDALAAMDALASGPLAAADLEVARWHAAIRFAYAHDSVEETADALANGAAFGLAPEQVERFGDALAAVTPAAVQAHARAAFGRELVLVTGDAARLVPALRDAALAPEVVALPPEKGRR